MTMNKASNLRCLNIIWMLLLLGPAAQGQLKLGSNPAVINKSSVLELESNVQGLLLPRIPDTTATTLTTAPNGMIIFFTPDNSLMIRKNGFWRRVADTANFTSLLATSGWALGGNSVQGIRTLGTTSNFDLPVITNSIERMRITNAGNVGIGSAVPSTKLHVEGTNPLTLMGVQNGTSTTADSLLTITGGLVRKIPILSFSGWALDGNAVLSARNFGTTSNFDLPVITNNLERMRITNAGNIGIGVTAPSTKLHVQGANPLTLTGVQAGTSTTADSLLTITSGLVRKIPMSTFVTGTGIWSTSGNSSLNSGVNFLGTTDNVSLRFRTNNVQRMYIDSARGLVGIGTNTFDATNPEKVLIDAGTTTSVNALYLKGSIDSYFQVNIRNLGTGSQSSSDFVATADNGTESTNFMNIGINGSQYVYQAGNPIETGKANDCYVIGSGNDLYVVNNNATKNIIFLVGGTAATNEAMRMTPSERVGIATTTPQAKLDVGGDFKMGASGSVLSGIYKTSFTLTDNTGISYSQSLTRTVTINGLATQSSVIVNPRSSLSNGVGIAYAYVSAANTLTINFINSGGSILGGNPTLGTVTFDITVIK